MDLEAVCAVRARKLFRNELTVYCRRNAAAKRVARTRAVAADYKQKRALPVGGGFDDGNFHRNCVGLVLFEHIFGKLENPVPRAFGVCAGHCIDHKSLPVVDYDCVAVDDFARFKALQDEF